MHLFKFINCSVVHILAHVLMVSDSMSICSAYFGIVCMFSALLILCTVHTFNKFIWLDNLDTSKKPTCIINSSSCIALAHLLIHVK